MTLFPRNHLWRGGLSPLCSEVMMHPWHGTVVRVCVCVCVHLQETRLGISLLPNLYFGTCKRLSPDNVAMIMDYYGYVGRTDGGWCVFVWAGVAG